MLLLSIIKVMTKTRKKSPRSFFKIKQKLVLIPPKKFLGRKLLGVFCLTLGSLILSSSAIYFYLIPALFPKQPKVTQIVESKPQFSPERIIIPAVNLNLSIRGGNFTGKIPPVAAKVQNGNEIFVLGGGEYRIYLTVGVETRTSTASNVLVINGKSLQLVLPILARPTKDLLIRAEQVE